jgi:ABC-2 type transport system permease protein
MTMNNMLLRLLDLLQGLYRLMGVNYQQLRAIVGIKLTMDNRRQIISYRKKENQEPANTFAWTMFFYALFGGFIALALYGISSFIFAMIVFFSYIMVMVAMTLITDFSSILLDTSDNTIILPRPVDSRTLFIARTTHIFLYLGQVTAGLAAFPALVVLLKYGLVMFLFFIGATILAVLTAVFITNAFYLLILQFASEERLKNVINYFQIIMAVAIMGGYQLMPRIAGRLNLEDYVFQIRWWSFLTPPVWMAGALETYDFAHLTLTLFAVAIPVLGFYGVNKYLAPVFTRKLGVMAVETKTAGAKTEKAGWAGRISTWIAHNPLERGAFELIFSIIGRDRKIKLKVYPSFGYILVFGFIFMFRGHGGFMSAWNSLPDTQNHLILIYLTFMILQVALYEIPYSDDFKASWIYFSSPLETPGDILGGTVKALFVRLFLPAYFVISMLIFVVWGWKALDDLAFGLFNNMLMMLIIVLVNKRYLPLSVASNARNQAGSFIRSMIVLALIGVLGFTHYFLARSPGRC